MSEPEILNYEVSAETADIFWKNFHQHVADVRKILPTINKENVLESVSICKGIMSNMQKCKNG